MLLVGRGVSTGCTDCGKWVGGLVGGCRVASLVAGMAQTRKVGAGV